MCEQGLFLPPHILFATATVLCQIPRWPPQVACLNLLPLMEGDEARVEEELSGLVLSPWQ